MFFIVKNIISLKDRETYNTNIKLLKLSDLADKIENSYIEISNIIINDSDLDTYI